MQWSFFQKDWWRQALCPDRCLVCARTGDLFCDAHRHQGSFMSLPLKRASYMDQAYAATLYSQPESALLIKKFKFKGQRSAGHCMGLIMAALAPDFITGPVTFVPVPLHWRRRYWRGFNQAEMLACVVAQTLQQPYETKLKRSKYTTQQARLGASERVQNLQNAFVYQGLKVPKTVVLVDDVYTTGNTLNQAAKTLKKAGVKTVIAFVFAYQSLDRKAKT